MDILEFDAGVRAVTRCITSVVGNGNSLHQEVQHSTSYLF